MTIQALKPAQLTVSLAKVERVLKNAPRMSKSLVLQTLARQGLCSATSYGVEKTFLKALRSNGISITPNFGKLMNVSASSTGASQPAKSKPSAKIPTPFVNLKSMSAIVLDGKSATTLFQD